MDPPSTDLQRRYRSLLDSVTALIPPEFATPFYESSDEDKDPSSAIGRTTTTINAEMSLPPTNSTPPKEANSSEVGMSVGLKNLYSSKEDKHGRYQWVTTSPVELAPPAEDAESEKWALVARWVPAYFDPMKTRTLHSVAVQSPLIKEILRDVLANYPGIRLNLNRVEFSGNFAPLVHRWPELEAAIDKLRAETSPEGQLKLQHGELLVKTIEDALKHEIQSYRDMSSQGVITFKYLWAIFHPGAHIYSKQQNQERVYQLVRAKYGIDHNKVPCYALTCQYVEYDGTQFGTKNTTVMIGQFDDTRPIISLAAYPLKYHSSKDTIVAKLIERGARVEGLAGVHYRSYDGLGFRPGPPPHYGNEKTTVKGRIVVDAHGWNKFNPDLAILVTPFGVPAPTHDASSALPESRVPGPASFVQRTGLALATSLYNPTRSTGIHMIDVPGAYDENAGSDDGIPADGFYADEGDNKGRLRPLTGGQKLICTPLVRGYALKEKMWLNLFINAIHDISFSDKAFESLVLPKNQKELILGYIRTQSEQRTEFDDMVQGKGRGMITLLYGPPGVGKTLTAECVAEEMKVPLVVMTSGDLGYDPGQIEIKLNRLMSMCTRWNAIFLLDEADVFLEARKLHELERNKLVSIFLRTLEYYQGIMFLTTNRVETFDAAFQSRIHISIVYSELDRKSRCQIWSNFLKQYNTTQAAARKGPANSLVSAAKSSSTVDENATEAQNVEDGEKKKDELHLRRTQPHAMSDTDIEKLAEMQMNGRMIKNVLKNAQLMASQKGEGLSYQHVTTAMEFTQQLHIGSRESETSRQNIYG